MLTRLLFEAQPRFATDKWGSISGFYRIFVQELRTWAGRDLTAYLSKKYGAPTKETKLSLLPPLKEDEYVRTFGEWWYLSCDVGAILSRAEWKQGNMKIVTGITSSGRIFISFLDEKALSHANLDEHFKGGQTTKAKVAWW